MTTSFGADPLKDSNNIVTVGTTAADLQQIFGSLYSAGLIAGGVVTRSSTALTYSVSNGVAAFPIVSDASSPYKPENQRSVVGPIPATPNITTTAPPSGQTRTDIVYAQQLTPTNDSDASVVVRVGTVLPPRAVLLGQYLLTSSATNTMAATPSTVVKYSIPYGASLGRIVNMTNMFNSTFTVVGSGTQPRSSLGTATFNLPTDRLCKVSLTVAVSASGATGFDNTKYCEAGYEVYIDNIKKFTWTTAGLHQAWMEYGFEGYIESLAGSHTIRVDHYRAQGPGTPVGRTASPDQPYARIIVEDIGPIP
jgi:hypothetical protein